MHAKASQIEKLQIIRKRADFVKIAAAGRKWVSHGVIVQILPNTLGAVRIGYTVTKKTDVRAVVRNRIKRRLRAVAADVLSTMLETEGHKINAGFDVVLIGRPATASRLYETLRRDLSWCLDKLLKPQDGGA